VEQFQILFQLQLGGSPPPSSLRHHDILSLSTRGSTRVEEQVLDIESSPTTLLLYIVIAEVLSCGGTVHALPARVRAFCTVSARPEFHQFSDPHTGIITSAILVLLYGSVSSGGRLRTAHRPLR